MINVESMWSLALWLAGMCHFCLLGASVQLPFRLSWKEELQKVSAFNRKLMWTYYYFTILTIIWFGIMTFVFHNEFLRGDRAALALALFIGIYWLARIAYDLFYFSHDDWPKGVGFVIGHLLLLFSFVALSTTYFGLVMWHVYC